MERRNLALLCAGVVCFWLFALAFGTAQGKGLRIQPAVQTQAEPAAQTLTVTPPQLTLPCRAAILIDQTSGTVLYEMNADQTMPIASITKVMTLLLTFEAVHAGRLTMDTAVPVSEHAYHMGGSQIWLEPGEQFTLDEMIKARFMEIFGDSETNTKNWRVLPMSKICSVGSSKRIYQSEQSSSGVPFWRISDLTSLITTGTVTPELYIPEERYKELKTQGQVPAPGDILITSRGTLGQCYIVKVNDRFYFQDGMISWLSGYMDGVTPLYISYLFTMPGFRKQIDSMQAGSTVAYLSITMIKKLKVMLPDIESQQQFASFVSKTEKTKTTISRSLEKLETLKKALMQEYFG